MRKFWFSVFVAISAWLALAPLALAAEHAREVLIYDQAASHNQKSIDLGEEEDWQGALKEAQLAVQQEKYYGQYRANLSYVYLKIGDCEMHQNHFAEAGQAYREALFYYGDNNVVASNLDECIRYQGKDARDLNVRIAAAEQAEREHHWNQAVAEYSICLKLAPTAENYFNLGRCELLAGDQAGTKHLKKALEKSWGSERFMDRAVCRELLEMMEQNTSSRPPRLLLIELSEKKVGQKTTQTAK